MKMSKPGVQQGSSYASVHKQTTYFSTAIICLQNNHRHSYKPLPCQHLSIAPLHFLPLANQIIKIPRSMEYIEYMYIHCVFQILSPPVICFNVPFQYVSMAFASISMHQIASNFMQIETSHRLF